jgi:hypothetical protein
MDFVEIIGAPGVGKSVIYDGLQSMSAKAIAHNAGWHPADFFFADSRMNKASVSVCDRLLAKIKWLFALLWRCGGGRSASLWILRGSIKAKDVKRASEVFLDTNPGLVQRLWRYIDRVGEQDYRGIDMRFSVAYSFLLAFGRYQAVLDTLASGGGQGSMPSVTVFDEGLLHKIANILLDEPDARVVSDGGEVNAFLAVVPAPRAIIHCDAPLETLTNRAQARQSVMYGYKTEAHQIVQETARKQRGAAYVAGFYAQKGVPVLNLDMDMPAIDNINKASEFLSGL